MNEQLHTLIEMQKLDDVISQKIELTRSLPKQLSGMKLAVKNADEEVEETQAKLDENKKTQKLKELEIKSNIEQMGKYKNQLLNVQTNKEYKALNSEVSHLEKKNSVIDDEILQMMEDENLLKKHFEMEKKIQAEAQAELKANENKINQQIDKVTLEIKEKRAKRNALAHQLPRHVVKRYAALIKGRNRKAVVYNNTDKCGGCGYILRPQLMIELKKADKIINCENCGRMLVFNDSDSDN
ncbi:MAG: C4-type zinc ribbon domain-containing protein [Candidatus Cloacimonadales bacterium]